MSTKKGVSLVTVLLFMMVATIAATATYKWLSSAGSSSAARMKVIAARELAVSGIEATRSWMSYNGNDVGAVIKQYFDKNNGGKPIFLNPILSKSFSDSNKDSVWLVGVSVDRQNYRLKILSVSTLDDNTKYSEMAIMNVGGLFQVSLPSTNKKVNLSEAFHGTLGAADSLIVDAAVIKQQSKFVSHGSQMLNGIKSSKYLVMDGSFYVNRDADVHDLYVTGDLDFGNNLTASGQVYVGGNLFGSTPSNTLNISGSCYVKGDFKPEDKSERVKSEVSSYGGSTLGGVFKFGSNLTIGGSLEHFSGTYGSKIMVDSNLVVGQKLKIKSGEGAKDSIRVRENAYIDKYQLAAGAKIPLNTLRRTYMGSVDHNNKVYVGGMRKYENLTACESNGYKCAETTNGDVVYVAYQGEFTSGITPTELASWKADSLPQYAQKLSEKETGGGCGEVAKSPIQFNKDILNTSYVRNAEKPMGCDDRIWSDADNYVDLINTCYDIASSNGTLFDKNWLILEYRNGLPDWKETDKKFDRNIIFVIHATSVPDGGFVLPQTTEQANVVLYLPEGWKNEKEGSGIRTTEGFDDTYYHYFVYSAGDIGSMTATKTAKGITGAIFMEGCSVFNSIAASIKLSASFDETMVDLLASANIICDNDGSGLCSNFTGIATDYVGGAVYSTVDEYFISTSPQLTVSMESQYRNNEKISRDEKDFNVVKPSAVVLPRVVYLTQDPVGRLSDYYNVIGVNGSKQTKNAAKMSCPSPLTSGNQLLYDNSSLLTEGKYICTYEEAAQKEQIPLFVVVEGLMNETPDIHFEKERIPVTTGHYVMVSLVFPSEGSFSVDIKAPSASSMPYGWEPLEPQSGVTKKSESGAFATYTVSGSGSTDPIPVFRVTAGEYAEKADVDFQLMTPCTGCKITKPDIATVSISNLVTVKRVEIPSLYCGDIQHAESFKERYGVSCEEVLKRPACEKIGSGVAWVKAKGCRVSNDDVNNTWNCNTEIGTTWLEDVLSNTKDCEVFIPDTAITLSSQGDTYYLPASLKRKLMKFHLKFTGQHPGASVVVNVKRSGALNPDVIYCSKDSTIDVFANDTVYTSRASTGTANFSYWSCDGADCGEYANKANSDSVSKTIITDVDTITYHFNEKDTHCFYTDFSGTKDGWCSGTEEDCFDYCKSKDHCSITEGNSSYAEWFVPIKNKTVGLISWSSGFRNPDVSNGTMSAPDDFWITKLGDALNFSSTGVHPTVVLNTAEAGYNGQMTSLFEVPTFSSQMFSQIINDPVHDGFIFRSNEDASEYFLLSIVSEIHLAGGYRTYAKLCQTGNMEDTPKKCVSVPFKTGLTGNANVVETKFGRSSLNIDVKDNIVIVTLSHSVLGSTEYRPAVAQIDLAENFTNFYNDDAHSRVGLKFGVPYASSVLGNDILKIFQAENLSMVFAAYDIGWRSYNYEESCWDTPSVSCSFKSNYAGGMVPKDSLVTPWVGMSSWFDGKDCEVTYFYNGCDLDEGMYVPDARLLGLSVAYGSGKLACALTKDKGFYLWHARQLDNYNRGVLRGQNYLFEEEGYHGYPYNGRLGNGTVKEASVLVHCRGTADMNVHTYDASCGDYIVGTFEECSESYAELLARNQVCHDGDELCIPDWNVEQPINVRDAVISFTVNDLNGGEVNVYLVSDEDILSNKALTIRESGDYSFDVAVVSEEAGFNPQKVKGLAFRAHGTNGFYVTHVQSYCKYAFGLTCKPTAYDAMNKQWVVGAEVLHSERADKCKVVPLNGRVSNSSVPAAESCSDFEQRISQNDVYGQEVEEDYSFRIIAYDAEGHAMDSCETEPYTAPAFNLTCNVSKEKIDQGYGLPSFAYSMSGCPEGGCSYTLKFPNDSSAAKLGSSGSGVCPLGGCRNYNMVDAVRDDKWSQGMYSYDVEVFGRSCVAGNTFEILPEPPKATCEESSVRIENGKFMANVIYDTEYYSGWKGEFNITVSGNFIVADPLGNILKNEEVDSDNPHFERSLPSEMGSCKQGWCKYVAILKLHGGELCPAEMLVYAPMNNLGCPAFGTLTDKSPSEKIDVLDTVPDCKDGNCIWNIKRGLQVIDEASSYAGGKLSFSGDNGAVGERVYLLEVARLDSINETTTDTVKKDCEFNVIYNNSALTTECGFASTQNTAWGGTNSIWLKSNCASCPYVIYTPSGQKVSGGTTHGTEGESVEKPLDDLQEPGEYKVVVNGAEESPCIANLNMASLGTVDCKPAKTSLSIGQTTSMTATLPCATTSCRWNWELEKVSAGTRTTGTTGPNVNVNVPGYGSYRFYVNGEQVCSFDVEKGKDCYFDKDVYEYNDNYKFTKANLNVSANSKCWSGIFSNYQCWEWSLSIGNETLNEGDEKTSYTNKSYSVSGSGIKKSGSYKFKAGKEECSANVIVKPYVGCKKEKETYLIRDDKYWLEISTLNCENCKYEITGPVKESGYISDGSLITHYCSNKSQWNNAWSVKVSNEYGEYTATCK